jgi:hypothetical protein
VNEYEYGRCILYSYMEIEEWKKPDEIILSKKEGG